MTLKELRISKGLNQGECANYLGMSTRNYQNYENNPSKVNTSKYNAIFQKLEAYGNNIPATIAPARKPGEFYTIVVVGTDLRALTRIVAKYKNETALSF